MSGPTRVTGRRSLTPAVLAAAAFLGVAALASVAFVTARGGLELPLAATSLPPFAAASPPPPAVESPASPTVTAEPPSTAPSPAATPLATPAGPSPSVAATAAPSGPPDPLAGLPPCPGHPGCFLYTVRRGDSYTAVSDRYDVGLWIMDALNPEVAVKRLIVIGQTLYLGHDPTARLDPCPDGTCHLYTVRSGDRLSTIAARYGLTVSGIEALNAGLDPNDIVTGEVLRLPLYQP